MSRLLVLAVVFVLTTPAFSLAAKLKPRTIDSLAQETLKRWKLPGLAVVLVSGDDVSLHGYGVRELGKKDPVTPDTVFALASLTKAFAATALGQLVDDGKAGWDDPVRKHFPTFRLFDPLADRDVRLRDLLCHRIGLSRHDLLVYRAPWSLDEAMKRMAHLEPTNSFRARYEYNNLAYIAAGMAIGKAAGTTWEDVTRKRLLEPLGMKNTVFTRKAALALADHATPHRAVGAKMAPIDWYADDDKIRAAGSLKSCARDLVGWLRLNLNGGMVGEKRIVSAKSLQEVHTPQIVVPVDRESAKLSGTTQTSYGLGWRISDHRGTKVIEHGGANDGFRARIVLLPGLKAGFVLLTNCEELLALQAMGNELIEELLGVEKKDWHAFYLKRKERTEQLARLARKAFLSTRKKDTKPSLALSAYAGKYHDAAYGEATVTEKDGKLRLTWSAFTTELEHFHFDTFLIKQSGRYLGETLRFELDRDGNVAAVHVLKRKFERARVKKQ